MLNREGTFSMNLSRFSILAAAAVLATAGIARADGAKPIRHLVYDVTVSINGSLSQQDYSGTTTSSGGGNGDRGQIVVDVMALQPDSGLVVNISEHTRGSRSADPAMCVTYGSGQIICESGKKINEEEYTLLRLLGKDFVNRAVMDSKNHWQFATNSSDMSETNDYTINSESNGVATIGLQRDLKVHGPQGYDASTTGKVTYSEKMQVPLSDSEETETRAQTGDSYNRVDQSITLNLASDSMQQQTAQTH